MNSSRRSSQANEFLFALLLLLLSHVSTDAFVSVLRFDTVPGHQGISILPAPRVNNNNKPLHHRGNFVPLTYKLGGLIDQEEEEAGEADSSLADSYKIVAGLDPEWFERFVVAPLGTRTGLDNDDDEVLIEGLSVTQIIQEGKSVRREWAQEQHEKKKQAQQELAREEPSAMTMPVAGDDKDVESLPSSPVALSSTNVTTVDTSAKIGQPDDKVKTDPNDKGASTEPLVTTTVSAFSDDTAHPKDAQSASADVDETKMQKAGKSPTTASLVSLVEDAKKENPVVSTVLAGDDSKTKNVATEPNKVDMIADDHVDIKEPSLTVPADDKVTTKAEEGSTEDSATNPKDETVKPSSVASEKTTPDNVKPKAQPTIETSVTKTMETDAPLKTSSMDKQAPSKEENDKMSSTKVWERSLQEKFESTDPTSLTAPGTDNVKEPDVSSPISISAQMRESTKKGSDAATQWMKGAPASKTQPKKSETAEAKDAQPKPSKPATKPQKGTVIDRNEMESLQAEKKKQETAPVPTDDRVVVYKTSASRPWKQIPLAKLLSLGYTENDISNLIPTTLELLAGEAIERPSAGIPARWKNKGSSSKDVLKIVSPVDARALLSLDSPKQETPVPTAKETKPTKEENSIPKEAPPSSRLEQQRRRRSKISGLSENSLRGPKKPQSKEQERRRRRHERSATNEDGTPKPVYSGRPPPNAIAARQRGDPPSPKSFIWPDIETFRKLLRAEAEFRLRILGDGWADTVKEETMWRHNLYSDWLWTLKNGIGNPLVESRSDRYRRIRDQARIEESLDMRKRHDRRERKDM